MGRIFLPVRFSKVSTSESSSRQAATSSLNTLVAHALAPFSRRGQSQTLRKLMQRAWPCHSQALHMQGN
jgi:hypothetical protein